MDIYLTFATKTLYNKTYLLQVCMTPRGKIHFFTVCSNVEICCILKANWFSLMAPPAFLKTDLVSHSWGQKTNSGMIAFLHTLTVSHLKVIVSYCIRSSYQCLAYGKHLRWIKACCVNNRKAGTTLLRSKEKAEHWHSPLCDIGVPCSNYQSLST